MRTKRIDLIEKYITEHKTVSLDTLCEVFQVSKNTIRRDVGQLVTDGSVKKVYGGVSAVGSGSEFQTLTTFTDRNLILAKEKNAMCRHAATMIEDNDIIFIDSGTSTQALIDYIAHKHCVIITNSLQVSCRALPYPNLTIISLPGKLNRDTLSFAGSESEQYLGSYNITKAFMSCTGVSIENGLTNATMEEYLIKKTIVNNCRNVILMADHTKFGKFTLRTYCSLSDIHQIVTDQMPDAEISDYCTEHGIQIYITK